MVLASIWQDFIDPLVNIWSYVWGFIKFCFSIPLYLESWYLELPDFIATGMTILLMLIIFFIVIEIVVLVKEVF